MIECSNNRKWFFSIARPTPRCHVVHHVMVKLHPFWSRFFRSIVPNV